MMSNNQIDNECSKLPDCEIKSIERLFDFLIFLMCTLIDVYPYSIEVTKNQTFFERRKNIKFSVSFKPN